jgi:dolichyl-phosphate beta-glucosyltransferase
MTTRSLSIIIPAYNEARRLPESLRAIVEYLERSRLFAAHEIIVVDDGSQDDTVDLAESFAHTHPEIKVLRAARNEGKGSALRRGVLKSRGDLVLCTDADLSTPIEEVQKLLPRIERDGYDVAIGSRKVARAEVQQPLYRRLIGSAGNVLIRSVLNLPFRDTQCGFKLYRRSAALRLFEKLHMPRFSFDFEILLRAKKLRMRVAEVGVRWSHSPYTTVRTSDIVQSFFDVFRVRFGLEREFGARLPSVELLKFMTVGVVNTLVDASVYVALTRVIAVYAGQPVTAKLFAFLTATVSSLMLNRYWTFKVHTPITLREIGKFYVSVSLGLLVNVSVMYAFVHLLGIYDLVALVLTTGFTFVVNFMLSKLWVFKPQQRTVLAQS